MSDFSGLDLDKIMRRGGGEEKKRELPSELYQIAIFYQRPVVEELELRKRDILFWKNKAESNRFIFPFYSKEIFLSEKEATQFIPYFIKRLITEEKIPADCILSDTSIDEDKIRPALVPLVLTFMERDEADEWKK